MLEMGLDPGYVLDRMEFYEIRALFKNRHIRHKESWEQTRMLSYIIARVAGSKIKEVKDLFSLPWDKENEEVLSSPVQEEISDKEEARLQVMARYLVENDLLNDV